MAGTVQRLNSVLEPHEWPLANPSTSPKVGKVATQLPYPEGHIKRISDLDLVSRF